MKYTDNWFKMPIRIYDGFILHKALLTEDRKLNENPEALIRPEPTDWVTGYVKLPLKEIECWSDYYTEGRQTEEVANQGFDTTLVETKNLGKYECMWKREKFEEELNKFYEKMTII